MLDGIRVLDFTMFLAGPYCTRLMADLGAEVIKVEPPNGDFYRNAPPVRAGRSAQFGHFNCGKKSLSVDLKKAAGVDVILRLAADCDVFIENFRPGVMGKLGLGYCALKSKARCRLLFRFWLRTTGAERASSSLCAGGARAQRQ